MSALLIVHQQIIDMRVFTQLIASTLVLEHSVYISRLTPLNDQIQTFFWIGSFRFRVNSLHFFIKVDDSRILTCNKTYFHFNWD